MEEVTYDSDHKKCKNCVHHKGGICQQSNKEPKESIINSDIECFTGYFEPIDVPGELRYVYEEIMKIIDYYMDVAEETKNLVALWIIGTYFHENFNTYPYLFVNAMRGSGKTRFMKIIDSMAKDSQLINSITEATMFRTTGTLLLDEFEGVGRKGNESLSELLNSSYKKGTKVFRMRKKKGLDGENQVVEEFQPYRPIAMANIWGMEEVLGDRCITVLLEKSLDPSKIKLVENFKDITTLSTLVSVVSSLVRCSWCSLCIRKNIDQKWNNFIKERYTPTTPTTSTTLHYTNYTNEELVNETTTFSKDWTPTFEKIDATKIDGRHLELFMPLFLVAAEIGDDILDKTLENATKVVQDKKIDEITESKDVAVYNMVASSEDNKWTQIKNLTSVLRLMIGESDNDWVNTRWLGKALKRLALTKKKRRLASGVEVILDVEKAKKMKEIFAPKEDDSENKA